MSDIVVVNVDSTSGWRASARELVGALQRAGANAVLAETAPVRPVRTFALTDFVQARAARRAAQDSIAQHQPKAVVYCSINAALLWPRPGAIWLDAIAAENRPGRHGVWQRVVERRRLAQAPLVLAMSERPGATVVPVPVAPSGPPVAVRDIAAVAYAGNPEKKRIEFVLDAWARARRPDETLVVAGIDRLPGVPEGVELAGRLEPDAYRALLRRARVFVAAPRREDYGIAPLEALADGCQLVTTPAPGPYPALAIARALDARLVDDDLVRALRSALDDPAPAYAQRAAKLLEPFSREAVDRTLARDVLPRLIPA